MEEVAARLKVSASTLYRHLPGGRGAAAKAAAGITAGLALATVQAEPGRKQKVKARLQHG